MSQPPFTLIPGGGPPGGRHWAAIIADFRRAAMRDTGGGVRGAGEAKARLRAVVRCDGAAGVLALFNAGELLKKDRELPVAPDFLFISTLLAVAGARGAAAAALLDHWTLAEPAIAGFVEMRFHARPDGLYISMATAAHAGISVILQFRGGPRLEELLQMGDSPQTRFVRFPAAAALLETREVESFYFTFPGFGRIEFQPDEAPDSGAK